MPASLIARDLTVTRGAFDVLAHVELTLSPGHRVGVIGPNGIGKSTLLQALGGRLTDTTTSVGGSVTRVPASATVGYLPQEADRRADETVDAFLARRTGVDRAQSALDAATTAMAEGRPGSDDQYSDALEAWLSLGAADFDARAGQVFADLSLTERVRSQPTATLSGGEAARVSLASLLLSRFDVVLLDEPTNDLDLDGLDRLERWVVGLDAPVALVSHDRSFLERTVTDVIEIDHHSHRVSWFAGGWNAFLDERALAKLHAQQRYDEYDTKHQALVDRGQREREWASQGAARVRKSDEADKHIRNFKMNQTEQLAGRAARTDRALERLDVVDEPRTAWELRYSIPTAGRSGDIVATANGAVVERGDFRLGPVDLDVAHGDRIAIVGPNGSGKSTLLDLLLGRRAPTSGRAGLGSSVVIGEIEQARDGLIGDDGLIAAFCAITGMDTATARTLLAKFRLGPDQLDRPGRTLSPGERTRAAMAVLMANGANLLVLDEPTNHLDLDAIEQLEHAIAAFDGTILLVTHDRTLLRATEFTRVIAVDAGVVTERDPQSIS
ncbi:MAG: ABC-F family ATP-binding cassette domain-containing protein [Ilumatobacter sp.]|uniref:ABC-F family ATP-binding cassette domain-containing protein n=3 Tax=Ilumatobacter sp. TaxID=1967498 RepID=UPI003297B228